MEINSRSRCRMLLVLCPIVGLMAGCAWDEERVESADFGESVRYTIALQTEYPDSAGTGMDAQKAANVMRAYREDVAKPKQVEKDIRLRVSQ